MVLFIQQQHFLRLVLQFLCFLVILGQKSQLPSLEVVDSSSLPASVGEEKSASSLESWWWFWDVFDETDNQQEREFNLENIETLGDRLNQEVIGQEVAVQITTEALLRYAVGLNEENAPIASFLYAGPAGVGKTELAKQLAKELLGDGNFLIQLNMAEYYDKSAISRLIGSPPGYTGSEQGGQLTNPLLKYPCSIVLLDEFDKACSEVQKFFLQAFDEGVMTSALGQNVNCRQVIWVLTTNLCESKIRYLSEMGLEPEDILKNIESDIIKAISPELYNRLNPAVFRSLSPQTLEGIVQKFLKKLRDKVYEKKKIRLKFDPALVQYFFDHGYHPLLGARPVKKLINGDLATFIAKLILRGDAREGDSIYLSYNNKKFYAECTQKKR